MTAPLDLSNVKRFVTLPAGNSPPPDLPPGQSVWDRVKVLPAQAPGFGARIDESHICAVTGGVPIANPRPQGSVVFKPIVFCRDATGGGGHAVCECAKKGHRHCDGDRVRYTNLLEMNGDKALAGAVHKRSDADCVDAVRAEDDFGHAISFRAGGDDRTIAAGDAADHPIPGGDLPEDRA